MSPRGGAPMTETEIQKQILIQFGNHPRLRIWRSNSGAARDQTGRLIRYNFPGYPDITGIIAPTGRALFIEVKSATGRQTKEQKQFQAIAERFGALYILARSVDDVDRALLAAGVA